MSLPARPSGHGADRPDHGRPVSPSTGRWRPLGLDEVRIAGGFWGDLQRLNAGTMIDHCERWLERLGWSRNFDRALTGGLPLERTGREFSDSEVYKLLEAMAWEVGRTGDADLDARLRALAHRVALAQEPDGYVGTMFGRPGQAPRYSDLEWGHELYCMGHLIQAGVARLRTHGPDELVDVAVAAADHVCREFGPDGRDGVCGHPEIEVALAELARATGRREYLDQARLFVERRGHGRLGQIELGQQYFQDDLPVRDATVLSGHAVRALYLAAGAADVAVEDGDAELLSAVTTQVLTTLARRMYLTGGMGSRHEGESFGDDYELPSDRAYSETCAGVASVMVNHRLLLAGGDVRHADAVERTLYNVVATSPAQDGRAFYYTNTLQQRVPGHPVPPDEVSPRAASSLRAPWFEVSCCPTNVTRLVASLGAYLASVDADGIQVHQYAPATIEGPVPGGAAELTVRTRYPDDGHIEVHVTRAPGAPWTLTLRVPSWAGGATLTVDGETTEVGPGYVQVRRSFAVGDVVVLDLPVAPRWTWADPRVDALRGQVAVERGPVVLALESVDAGVDVGEVVVSTAEPPVERDGAVLVPVQVADLAPGGEAYGADPSVGVVGPARDAGLVPLVPYHRWANRGPSTMRVWLPTPR